MRSMVGNIHVHCTGESADTQSHVKTIRYNNYIIFNIIVMKIDVIYRCTIFSSGNSVAKERTRTGVHTRCSDVINFIPADNIDFMHSFGK